MNIHYGIEFSVVTSQQNRHSIGFSVGLVARSLRTENREFLFLILTRPPQSQWRSDLPEPAAAGTSSQTPSTGRNGSAAMCPAPRYTKLIATNQTTGRNTGKR